MLACTRALSAAEICFGVFFTTWFFGILSENLRHCYLEFFSICNVIGKNQPSDLGRAGAFLAQSLLCLHNILKGILVLITEEREMGCY